MSILESEEKIKALEEALQEHKDAIDEWRLSSEAFKRLARSYSEKLLISDEQRKREYWLLIVQCAEEDPERYKGSRLAAKTLEALKSTGTT